MERDKAKAGIGYRPGGLRQAVPVAEDQDRLARRLEPAQVLAASIGVVNPNFDEKAWMDEMWGEGR